VLLPAETATALVPRSGARESDSRLISTAQAAVQVYELDDHDQSHGFFFALGEEAWSFGPWSSDARVLYRRLEKDTLAHLILIGGTQVAWQGQPLLSTATPSAFFEWRKQDAVMNAAPAEFSITALFNELTDGSRRLSLESDHVSASSYAEKR
jgi:hypothetical protein